MIKLQQIIDDERERRKVFVENYLNELEKVVTALKGIPLQREKESYTMKRVAPSDEGAFIYYDVINEYGQKCENMSVFIALNALSTSWFLHFLFKEAEERKLVPPVEGPHRYKSQQTIVDERIANLEKRLDAAEKTINYLTYKDTPLKRFEEMPFNPNLPSPFNYPNGPICLVKPN